MSDFPLRRGTPADAIAAAAPAGWGVVLEQGRTARTIAIVWSGLAGGSSPISGEFTGPQHPEARRVIIANTGGAALRLPCRGAAPDGRDKKRTETSKRS